MLQKFFHAWERRLASVSTDRVVRPFEWGLEWIAPDGEAAPGNVRPEPAGVLGDWVTEAMTDTDAFFAAPPTDAYRLGGLLGGERRLTFPSAFDTPHPKNNIVHCRYFAASRPVRGRARGAVLVLPQWN